MSRATEDGQALEMIRKRTQTAAARNLVELRGHALKNYEVAHEGKSRHAATTSDRCDPMLDREVNKFNTNAKSVHLHHLVLVEFDSVRARTSGGSPAKSALRYSTNAASCSPR